jgi:hypothetical protein
MNRNIKFAPSSTLLPMSAIPDTNLYTELNPWWIGEAGLPGRARASESDSVTENRHLVAEAACPAQPRKQMRLNPRERPGVTRDARAVDPPGQPRRRGRAENWLMISRMTLTFKNNINNRISAVYCGYVLKFGGPSPMYLDSLFQDLYQFDIPSRNPIGATRGVLFRLYFFDSLGRPHPTAPMGLPIPPKEPQAGSAQAAALERGSRGQARASGTGHCRIKQTTPFSINGLRRNKLYVL